MTDDQYVREQMQDMGRYVKGQLPKGWGFIVLAFPFEAGGRINYISNAHREDVVRALYEFIGATKERYASHVSGSREHEDTELSVLRQRVAELEEFVAEISIQSLGLLSSRAAALMSK